MAGSASVCAGDGTGECQFSTDEGHIGKAAALRPSDVNGKCVFCDNDGMTRAFANARTKGILTTTLRFFSANCSDDVYQAALEKVPGPNRDRVVAAVQAKIRTKGAIAERTKVGSMKKPRTE